MAIQDYFIHVVTLLPNPPHDEWGEPIGEATPAQYDVPARVEWDRKVIRRLDGREIVCSGPVFLDNRVSLVQAGDRIEFEGHTYTVEAADRCETNTAFGGDRDREHWEVYIR